MARLAGRPYKNYPPLQSRKRDDSRSLLPPPPSLPRLPADQELCTAHSPARPSPRSQRTRSSMETLHRSQQTPSQRATETSSVVCGRRRPAPPQCPSMRLKLYNSCSPHTRRGDRGSSIGRPIAASRDPRSLGPSVDVCVFTVPINRADDVWARASRASVRQLSRGEEWVESGYRSTSKCRAPGAPRRPLHRRQEHALAGRVWST